MKSKNIRWLVALGLLGTFSGCVKERPSAIVDMLRNSGATDVYLATETSIQGWLAKHPNVAEKTESMCKQVRPTAPVEWAQTTEGRACEASAQIVFFKFTPRKEDHRTYGAGLK